MAAADALPMPDVPTRPPPSASPYITRVRQRICHVKGEGCGCCSAMAAAMPISQSGRPTGSCVSA